MYQQSTDMITRAFLFLLAMLTGFSTAQAADSLRPAPSAIGSAAISSATVAASVSVFVRRADIQVRHPQASKFNATLIDAHYSRFADQIAPTPRTYPSDRSRQ
jgi:hypothetical protein